MLHAGQTHAAERAIDAVWQGFHTVDRAHSHAGIVRVQGTTLETNPSSQGVLERCGFEREGLLRRYRMVRGRPGNFWMFGHVGASS
jgi:ribosomal-protein-alanine N-acetyltransferase